MSCHVMRCGIMSGDVTTSCCCHEKCITNSAPATKSDTPTSPNSTPATKSDTPTSANLAPATKSDAPTSNSAHARTSHTPTSPNSALATKSRTPTSPNAAPATKSHITLCDAYHMRRHLQWRTSRPWAEHDPNMIRPWGCNWPRLFAELNLHPILYGRIQRFALRLSTNHQMLPWLRKSDTPTSWNSARAIKSQTPASPDVKNETLQRHQMLRLPRNVTLQHHQMLRLPRKMTVQHHAKFWLTRNMTVMIDLRHTWSVLLQRHQTLRLVRNMSFQKYRENYSCGLEDRILVKKKRFGSKISNPQIEYFCSKKSKKKVQIEYYHVSQPTNRILYF